MATHNINLKDLKPCTKEDLKQIEALVKQFDKLSERLLKEGKSFWLAGLTLTVMPKENGELEILEEGLSQACNMPLEPTLELLNRLVKNLDEDALIVRKKWLETPPVDRKHIN